MSYLSSNEPYQRVDDGIGAGLVGGAVIGGAIAGAAHYLTSPNAVDKLISLNNKIEDAREKRLENKFSHEKFYWFANPDYKKARNRINDQHFAISEGIRQSINVRDFAYGSGKRAAITYSASVLGSAILGGFIDHANN